MTDCSHATKGGRKKPFDFSKCKQRHIALKILYFGWDYDGLAEQSTSDNTIEHHLISALLKTCLIESRQKCNFQRCGRTDKGVSSFGQVVNLNVRSNLTDETQNIGLFTPSEGYTGSHGLESNEQQQQLQQPTELNYVDMLNGLLPDHIKAIAWSPVQRDFSSRHSCKGRAYSYVFPKGDLSIDAMSEAASYLVGMHDFRNLCSFDLKNGVVNHERTIYSTCVRAVTSRMSSRPEGTRPNKSIQKDDRYSFYEVIIVGKGFLYHQIRCIMTILFLVGRKRESPEVIRDLLDLSKCPARPKYCPASPLPLSLFECHYDKEDIPQWHYSQETLFDIYKRLKQLWVRYKTKTVMIERVLFEMEAGLGHAADEDVSSDVACDIDERRLDSWKDFGLEHDNMSDSKYIPILRRPREDSLEHKLDLLNYKRQKLKSDEIEFATDS